MNDDLVTTRVFDDIVDEDTQRLFEKQILSSTWTLVDDMSYNNSKYKSYGLNCLIKHPTHGMIRPELYDNICKPIIDTLSKRTDLHMTDIVTARSFLQLPLEKKFYKNTNGVHVDLPTKHVACVYYVNDSDGDTVIYEETVKSVFPGSTNVELHEHARVTPKRGRIVMFDGFRYHCSSQPRNSHRCIINFNLA